MNGDVQARVLASIPRKMLRLAGLVRKSPALTTGLCLSLSLLFFLSVVLWKERTLNSG